MDYNFLYYVIITGSRTGSSYLCDLLESTGRAGRPDEYFNEDMQPYYLQHVLPKTDQSYLDKITWGTKKANFVVGAKLNSSKQIELAEKEGFLPKVSKFIWLRRENEILQAISRYKAWETGAWDANQIKRIDKRAEYDYSGIKTCLESIYQEEEKIQEFLKGKSFMEIFYEGDLLENPQQTIICILQFLGLPSDELPTLKSNQKITRNEESFDWCLRFTNELVLKDFQLMKKCVERNYW